MHEHLQLHALLSSSIWRWINWKVMRVGLKVVRLKIVLTFWVLLLLYTFLGCDKRLGEQEYTFCLSLDGEKIGKLPSLPVEDLDTGLSFKE